MNGTTEETGDGRRRRAATLEQTATAAAATVADAERRDSAAGPIFSTPQGYQLGEEIGRGGVGVVYRAKDVALDRDVAVKLLHGRYAPDSSAAARFIDEARIMGQLQHPGIPAVHQVGALGDGRPYLAMKFIKGRTLDELLAAGASVDVAAVFEAVCQAVGYAHAHGVVHRDLKPTNVMVGAFGEVQVMDWGLAKVLGRTSPARAEVDEARAPAATEIRSLRDSDGSFTQAGSVLGTPAFMPPEQAAGELEKVDARSDVFGLGAILCVLLTGKPPFDGADAESVRLNAVRGRTGEALRRLDGSGADPALVALCKRCLAFEPADRPESADAVAAEVATIRRAADERARQAERDRLAVEVRAAEQQKRRRAVQRAALIVSASLLLGVVGTTAGLLQANAARNAAVAAAAAEAQQKRVAQAKEAEADAVVKFFQEHVFAAARPKGRPGGLGKDVSLREALDASLPALAAGFKDQPLVEARLRNTLGNTFAYLGDHKAAIEQYERERALFNDHARAEDEDALRAAGNLAASYAALGRKAEALKLREEVVAARRRTLAAEHPQVLLAESALANSLAALDRGEEALRLREEVFAARNGALPKDHPETLRTLSQLANSYEDGGQASKALELREQVLAAQRRVLPADHPDLLGTRYNLALSYAAAGRHEEALKLREETLAAYQRILPPNHPDLLRSMNNLAKSYADAGRTPEALKMREAVLDARRRTLPHDHPDTLRAMDNVAASYNAAGRHAEALKLYQEALAGQRRVLRPDDPETLLSLGGVAEALVKVNRGAEAIPLIDECVARAAGKRVESRLMPHVLDARLRHFERTGEPAGCRATAAMWEKLGRADAESLFIAARFRGVAAKVYAKAGQPRESSADAARAGDWLKKAVDAGFRDRVRIETNADLEPLRARPDFQTTLASLPAHGN